MDANERLDNSESISVGQPVYIAKSQAAKGLQVSAIKASLAQLSQRCRVMLLPLTEQEINYYTRRNPLAKPERTNSCTKEKKIFSPLKSANVKPRSKPKKPTSIISEHSDLPSKISKDKKIEINKPSTSNKVNRNLKRKFEELFGHDPEESSFQHDKVIVSQQKSNVNYVSTTLNVNIFTDGRSEENSSNKNELKRKKPVVEGHKTKNSSKKLRIDVSLSNDELYADGNVNIAGIQISNDSIVSKTACARKKTAKQKGNSTKSKAKKSKIKFAIPSSSSTINITEEDSAIKELWSILGMESPTVRSKSIKNCVFGKSAINLDGDDKIRSLGQPSNQTEKEALDSDAVCQISGTFSLADSSEGRKIEYSSSFEDQSNKSKSIQNVDGIGYNENSHQNVNSSELCESNKIGKIKVRSIDSLMNPPTSSVHIPINVVQLESIPANVTDAQRHLPSSSFQTDATSVGATSEKSTLQYDIEPSCGSEETEQSKKCFFATYQYYFNEFVESKIPKLGEILHLAIGDEIRRKERIKAATQLSSEHFKAEEKQRACFDFRDVMKLRGEEFAPPFCYIFQGFEENSQVTLFFALLHRVLKNAIQIDSHHKYCILEAKTVILTMLVLSNTENTNIVSILKSDFNEFEEQLNIVSTLVDEYYLMNTTERQLKSSKRSEKEGSTSQNSEIVTSNLPVENSVRNVIQKNTIQGSQSDLLNSNTNIVPQDTTNMCAIPSYVQIRGNLTEARNRSSPSEAGRPTTISSISTVNKDTRSSALHRPQPSQIPFSDTNVSINKASFTPISSLPSSSYEQGRGNLTEARNRLSLSKAGMTMSLISTVNKDTRSSAPHRPKPSQIPFSDANVSINKASLSTPISSLPSSIPTISYEQGRGNLTEALNRLSPLEAGTTTSDKDTQSSALHRPQPSQIPFSDANVSTNNASLSTPLLSLPSSLPTPSYDNSRGNLIEAQNRLSLSEAGTTTSSISTVYKDTQSSALHRPQPSQMPFSDANVSINKASLSTPISSLPSSIPTPSYEQSRGNLTEAQNRLSLSEAGTTTSSISTVNKDTQSSALHRPQPSQMPFSDANVSINKASLSTPISSLHSSIPTPSYEQSRGNLTEAQNRLSLSEAGTTTSSISTVNKDTQSSALHRPQPSQMPFSDANVSINKASLSTPISSLPSSIPTPSYEHSRGNLTEAQNRLSPLEAGTTTSNKDTQSSALHRPQPSQMPFSDANVSINKASLSTPISSLPSSIPTPSYKQSRGNLTEAQNRLSLSEAGTTTSSISTVNKDTQSSALHRPQPSQMPFSDANVSINKASLSTPISSLPSSIPTPSYEHSRGNLTEAQNRLSPLEAGTTTSNKDTQSSALHRPQPSQMPFSDANVSINKASLSTPISSLPSSIPTPSYKQSRGNLTEAQNRLSLSEAGTTTSSISTVNKDNRSSAPHRPQPSQIPFSDANVSTNKASLSGPISSVPSSHDMVNLNKMIITNKALNQGSPALISRINHNNGTTAEDSVLIRLLETASTTNDEIMSKESIPSNQITKIVLNIACTSASPALQLRPVSLVQTVPNNSNDQNKVTDMSDSKSSNTNVPLTSNILTNASQPSVNTVRTCQPNAKVSSASRATASEKRPVPDLLKIRSGELNPKDAVVPVNVQICSTLAKMDASERLEDSESTSVGQPVSAGRERHTIWQGVLEWIEKPKTANDAQKNTRHVSCQVSAHSKDGEPELKADSWPQKLIMQLMPKQLLGNIGGVFLKDSKSVLFHSQPCEALESLTKLMSSGFAGCVHFTSPCDIKVLILLYTAERRAYLGFIPNDQVAFVDRLCKVIQHQKSNQALSRQGQICSTLAKMDASERLEDSESTSVGQPVSVEDNHPNTGNSTTRNLHTSNVNRNAKRVHSQEEIFSCSLCPYKTSKKNCLPIHIRLAHRVKQYSCKYCDFKTSDQCELSEHVEYKHEPFACTKCEYKTENQADFK